jgi:hypothetical protein
MNDIIFICWSCKDYNKTCSDDVGFILRDEETGSLTEAITEHTEKGHYVTAQTDSDYDQE